MTKQEKKEYSRKWKKDNSGKVREYQRKWYKANSEKLREYYKVNSRWKKEYGRKRIKERMEKMAGRKKPEQCEVCGAFGKDIKKGICYDHDHKTGKFRGWICLRCNFILGYAKDSPDLLINLVKYLQSK